MARSKAIVSREENGNDPLKGAHGHGVRQPQTAAYRNEKQKLKIEVKAPKASTRSHKGVVEDEGSHTAEHGEMDL
ncbi:hypothetical protein Syun_012285 [Stephania yunnanensis]|uniref:Uncharacterized protein n=1 Tax=Stephania yunnanensis TaxID=152371 RepID=A0AAP0PIV6_9MAGN